MNNIQILGTITRDVELKYSQSGTAIASFGIAYNDKWKDQSGQVVEKAHFFDVTVIGKQSEIVNKFFHKGSRILIDGSLDFSQWVDKDGQKRSKVGIKLNRFTFVDKANNQDNQGSQNNQQQGYQQPQQGQAQQYQQPQQVQTQYQNAQGQPVPQQQYQQNMQQHQMPQNNVPEIDMSDEIPF